MLDLRRHRHTGRGGGTNRSLRPQRVIRSLADATFTNDQVTVPSTKDFVKDASNVDEAGHLSVDQERDLYSYYSRTDYHTTTGCSDDDPATAEVPTSPTDHPWSEDQSRTTAETATDQDADVVGRDVSGPTTDDAMTVSEEPLRVLPSGATPAGSGSGNTWSPRTSPGPCRCRRGSPPRGGTSQRRQPRQRGDWP